MSWGITFCNILHPVIWYSNVPGVNVAWRSPESWDNSLIVTTSSSCDRVVKVTVQRNRIPV